MHLQEHSIEGWNYVTKHRLPEGIYLKRNERFIPAGGCWGDCDEPTVSLRERTGAEEEGKTAVVWKSDWRMNFLQGRQIKNKKNASLLYLTKYSSN